MNERDKTYIAGPWVIEIWEGQHPHAHAHTWKWQAQNHESHRVFKGHHPFQEEAHIIAFSHVTSLELYGMSDERRAELEDMYPALKDFRPGDVKFDALITPKLPLIVCLCGSTRFSEAFQKANLEETLAGRIVLTIGCDMRSDADLFASMSDWERQTLKERLDDLHLRKIDLADEVLILNVGGYIGESTSRELAYARRQGKVVRFLEPEAEPV